MAVILYYDHERKPAILFLFLLYSLRHWIHLLLNFDDHSEDQPYGRI